MNKVTAVTLVATLAAAPIAAPAQTRTDPIAGGAIARGDLATAERRLLAERRIFPDRPEILLNLAAVYARTGRGPEARALYEAVLAEQPVLLDLSRGSSATSHAIAEAGLGRLGLATTAAR